MRVMVTVKTNDVFDSGGLRPTVVWAIGKFNSELNKAGLIRAHESLKPTLDSRRLQFQGIISRIDAEPYHSLDGLITCFWIWEVADLDQATEWAQRTPFPQFGPCDIDIRPLYEAAELDALVN